MKYDRSYILNAFKSNYSLMRHIEHVLDSYGNTFEKEYTTILMSKMVTLCKDGGIKDSRPYLVMALYANYGKIVNERYEKEESILAFDKDIVIDECVTEEQRDLITKAIDTYYEDWDKRVIKKNIFSRYLIAADTIVHFVPEIAIKQEYECFKDMPNAKEVVRNSLKMKCSTIKHSSILHVLPQDTSYWVNVQIRNLEDILNNDERYDKWYDIVQSDSYIDYINEGVISKGTRKMKIGLNIMKINLILTSLRKQLKALKVKYFKNKMTKDVFNTEIARVRAEIKYFEWLKKKAYKGITNHSIMVQNFKNRLFYGGIDAADALLREFMFKIDNIIEEIDEFIKDANKENKVVVKSTQLVNQTAKFMAWCLIPIHVGLISNQITNFNSDVLFKYQKMCNAEDNKEYWIKERKQYENDKEAIMKFADIFKKSSKKKSIKESTSIPIVEIKEVYNFIPMSEASNYDDSKLDYFNTIKDCDGICFVRNNTILDFMAYNENSIIYRGDYYRWKDIAIRKLGLTFDEKGNYLEGYERGGFPYEDIGKSEERKKIVESLSQEDKQLLDGIRGESIHLSGVLEHTIYRNIYRANDKPIAFVELCMYCGEEDDNTAYIALAVNEEYRNAGIGRELVEEALDYAAHNLPKIEYIGWTCLDINEASNNLAESLGFEYNDGTNGDMNCYFKENEFLGGNLYIEEYDDINIDELLDLGEEEDNSIFLIPEVLNEDSRYNPSLNIKRLLNDERIKNNKEIYRIYDGIKTINGSSNITKTYIDLENYKGLNLFFDLCHYNPKFIHDITKGLENINKEVSNNIEVISKITTSSRLNQYTRRTIIVPIDDWVKSVFFKDEVIEEKRIKERLDNGFMIEPEEGLTPTSLIIRMMKNPSNFNILKRKFNNIDFLFIGNSGYFKVNFNNFEKKDIPKFIKNIKTLCYKESFMCDDNKSSVNGITASLIGRMNDNNNVKIHSLTGVDKNISKEELDEKIKQSDEYKKKAIVSKVQQAAILAKDENEAMDILDKDPEIDKTLEYLDDLSDDSISIPPGRKKRMEELKKKFKDQIYEERTRTFSKHVMDRTIPLDKKPIKVESVSDDNWNNIKYNSFEDNVNEKIERMILDIMTFFGERNIPIGVVKYTKEHVTTSEDNVFTYTFNMEDVYGKRFTLKFDIPYLNESRVSLLRGNEKAFNAQMVLLPISKTDVDTAQIVSDYNKIFVYRYGQTRKLYQGSDLILKALSKYTGKNLKIFTGDNEFIANRNNTPIDYLSLAANLNEIITPNYTIVFNIELLKKQFDIDFKQGFPYGYNNKTKKVLYYNSELPFSNILGALLVEEDTKFGELLSQVKASSKYAYSQASIMASRIPLILVMAYAEGLQKILNKAHIKYRITEKREKIDPFKQDIIRFANGYLIYDLDYNSSLLMNGLKELDTDSVTIESIDNKTTWISFFDNYGGRLKADGLDNFYELMVDPNTKNICTEYKLPTDYISILAYANELLADTDFTYHTDLSSNRFRSYEIVASYTYHELARSYSEYMNKLKRANNVTMSIKQSAVIDAILADPTASDYSTLTPLLELEAKNTISFKGLSGMNTDRAYSIDKRSYDESMINKLALSTGFTGNVGITRQATIDMGVRDNLGTLEASKLEDMGTTKSLSITEALIPFGTTSDDPMRTSMAFIQSCKHNMPIRLAIPNLVSNGADEALPYLTSDAFSYKAKQDGTIKDITKDFMVIEYKDKSRDIINLKTLTKKNSDGGFYLNNKLDTDFKKGHKFKKGDILAYNKSCYSNIVGDNDNIAYAMGTLLKIAIMNSSEGFEDSTTFTDIVSRALSSDITVKKDITLPKETNIYEMVNVGDKVEEGDTLMVFQNSFDEEDANKLLKMLTDEEADEVRNLGRIPIKSKVTGYISDIKLYRTVDLNELSPSLKKIFTKYENNIKKEKALYKKNKVEIDNSKFDSDDKLPPTGKLKNCDGVMIEIYQTYHDDFSVGDKMVFYSGLKGVAKYKYPTGSEPYTDFRPNEKIHSILNVSSVNKRKVISVQKLGGVNKVLIELDRAVKKIMGIPCSNSLDDILEKLLKEKESNG